MTDLPPSVRSFRARAAAHRSWAKTPDRAARTAPAMAARMARFENEVDPDGVMDPGERRQRAQSLLKAQMAELTARSAEKRAREKSWAETKAQQTKKRGA